MSEKTNLKIDQAKVLNELEKIIKKTIKIIPITEDWDNSKDLIGWNIVGALVKDENVIELNLYNCNLKNLPESFGDLKMLKSLRLKRNKMVKLPESFCNLKELKNLDLSIDNRYIDEKNNLKELPNSFGNLNKLEILNLSNNQLKNLPESFGDLNFLIELNLEANKLEKLPNSFCNLKSIEKLNLGGNQLKELPVSFGNLITLNFLILGDNKLKSLPETIVNLRNLELLMVTNNNLSQLPNSIGDLHSLYSLILENNELISLPESIGELENLETLNVSFNKLSTLPDSIGKLEKLKFLELKYNEIKTIPNTIKNLKSLMELFLEHNLMTVPPLSVWHLPYLEIITLEENPLEDEYKEIILKNVPTILDFFREKSTIKVFISHAVADFGYFQIKQISDFLETNEQVYQAYYCEDDLVGDIDDFMNDTIPKTHVLLFFATRKSVFDSIDCSHELDLAREYGIPIYTIKGEDLTWKELEEINLKNQQGFEYKKETLQEMLDELFKIINQIYESRFDKERIKISKIIDESKKSINDFFRTEGFNQFLNENFVELEENFKNFNEKKISIKDFIISSLNKLIEYPFKDIELTESKYLKKSEKKKNLDKEQAKVIKEIEKSIGKKLPRSPKEGSISNGVWIEEGNIVTLQLENCRIKKLPESIGRLSCLKTLTLSENQLETLPESICNLVELEYLNLENNNLRTLPRCLWKWKNLKFIKMTFNPWEDELAPFGPMRAGFDNSYIDEILKVLWDRSAINIFIIYSYEEFKQYNIEEIAHNIVKEREINSVSYEELKDITNYHLFLFLASKKSINSEKCKMILNNIRKNSIHIIPIKGKDISWGDLNKAGLSRELGMEYVENLEKFCSDLIEYIKHFKREVNLFYPKEQKLENQLSNILNTFNNFLDSVEFRESIKDISYFQQNIDDYKNKKIPISGFLENFLHNIE